ncbi:SpoIIIAH-like family protein [Piscibacillus halophilus]|uniref:Stage III sporulation protein AH n=1 Tax=Piscibacillus halophilus TaxID=571933 RepID=A0A1H9A9D1_9BACI|nr:SpoIIIAH-like family protein [Piscibacillus halophilus]SEP73151.1 stage III sporulation protein AH [Piscibacillus halophilus]
MVLKKQTVWLITMLSLLIVLSVFYMTSPNDVEVVGPADDEENQNEETEETQGELPLDEENQNDEEGTDEEKGTEGEEEGTEGEGAESEGSELDVSGMTVDELFATTRLEKEDTRSELKEQWESVLASSDSSAEEKNEAMEKIHEIETAAQKESKLENTIQYEKDYRDVLVQKEEDVVTITVIADELSKTEANQIMQMARDEFGIMDVRVSLQEDDV